MYRSQPVTSRLKLLGIRVIQPSAVLYDTPASRAVAAKPLKNMGKRRRPC
jgi:hypothetical protein